MRREVGPACRCPSALLQPGVLGMEQGPSLLGWGPAARTATANTPMCSWPPAHCQERCPEGPLPRPGRGHGGGGRQVLHLQD